MNQRVFDAIKICIVDAKINSVQYFVNNLLIFWRFNPNEFLPLFLFIAFFLRLDFSDSNLDNYPTFFLPLVDAFLVSLIMCFFTLSLISFRIMSLELFWERLPDASSVYFIYLYIVLLFIFVNYWVSPTHRTFCTNSILFDIKGKNLFAASFIHVSHASFAHVVLTDVIRKPTWISHEIHANWAIFNKLFPMVLWNRNQAWWIKAGWIGWFGLVNFLHATLRKFCIYF